MKKVVILFLAMIIGHQAFCQQDKIKLYKNTFKSADILGGATKFGPEQVAPKYKTELISPPIAVGGLYDLIGKEYKKSYFGQTQNLLNMQLDESLGILDNINFQFFKSYSLKYVLDEDSRFQEGGQYHEKYKIFRQSIKNAKSDNETRSILYDNLENAIFLEALEQSKYTTYRPAIPITLTTDIVDELKFGITALIIAQLKKETNGMIDITTENTLNDSISKYVSVKNCSYNEIRYRDEYITKAGKALSEMSKDPSKLDKLSDDFAYRFRQFLKEPCAAIITGASVLTTEFDYSKFTQINTAIGAVLKGKFGLSDEEKNKISAKVTAQFKRKKSVDLKIDTAETSYYIKYVFHKDLELGANNCK